ncbi:MAG: hypothetical protein GY716_24385 [bacterium]|nr:hypothetical protein [bacterium]
MTGPPGYEEVRSKLLERGYLDNPLERFLLRDGDASRPRPASAALRAAAIGAPLLGLLCAVAVALANRPVVSGLDLPFLWLYFTPVAGLGLFALDLLVAISVGRLARKRGPRPGDTLRAALLVGAPTIVYLLMLWPIRRPSGRALGDLAFLALAVATTLLVAWLAGLVSVAATVGRTGRVPIRRRHLVAILALFFLPLGAGVFALHHAVGGTNDRAASPFQASASTPALLLVGIDGLDSNLLERFEPRGVLDNLMALLERSSVHPLDAGPRAEPAAVWTTLLTGMPSTEHGVVGAGSESLPGISTPLRDGGGRLPLVRTLKYLLPSRTVPTTGARRGVRTLPEIVSLAQPSLSVGGWASWPGIPPQAGGFEGYVVTDRALPKLLSGADADRDTVPESLFSRLAADFPEDRREILAALEAGAGEGGAEEDLIRESWMIDSYHWAATRKLLADDRLRAGFVYLPGLDVLRTRLRVGGVADVLARRQALDRYLSLLDGLIANVERTAPGWSLMLVADPGRQGESDAEGFLALNSPELARAACVGARMGRLDVVPLALRVLGFPLSAELPGTPVEDCLALERLPAAFEVATFGRRSTVGVEEPSPFDPDMVERLRSLGYLN